MMELNFSKRKNSVSKIETIINIFINFFCYEKKLTFLIYISEKFKIQ